MNKVLWHIDYHSPSESSYSRPQYMPACRRSLGQCESRIKVPCDGPWLYFWIRHSHTITWLLRHLKNDRMCVKCIFIELNYFQYVSLENQLLHNDKFAFLVLVLSVCWALLLLPLRSVSTVLRMYAARIFKSFTITSLSQAPWHEICLGGARCRKLGHTFFTTNAVSLN